ncbi:MAG: DNA ligase D [Gammaproteobacteria bacterium]|nr:DNA ligase D [Gammaproteobacteria bacterium]
MTLKLYQKKRDFDKTPEPKGKTKLKKKSSKKLLYLIQKHAASHLHYDFRLELSGVLKSWAVPKGPCLDPLVKRLAMHVEDHPLEYGTFEGIIPKGQYGGGTVMLWDQGTWICEDKNPKAAYEKGHLTFNLEGKKLKGRWTLIRIKNDNRTWLLIKSKDDYAKLLKKYDVTLEEPRSVVSNQSLEEISEHYTKVWGSKGLEKSKLKKKIDYTQEAQKKVITYHLPQSLFPKEVYPQLATLVNKPPLGTSWLHEIKLDGYRFIAFVQGKNVTLRTRRGHDWTALFPNITQALMELNISAAVLDGEIVVLDKHQHSNFQLLQNAIKGKDDQIFVYYLFDLIYYDHFNLSNLPLVNRKEILKLLIPPKNLILRYSEHLMGDGQVIFEKACALQLEGIISKNKDSIYKQVRTENWLKTKCIKRQEFIIAGYTQPRGKRSHFGALLLGTYNKQGELIYNGNVGTGFTESSLKEINTLLTQYKTPTMPFKKKPPGSSTATWIKPALVAEIEFSNWTDEGYLRHPSFKGLRQDKSPKTIYREKPHHLRTEISPNSKKGKAMTSSSFKLTHPEKILYPEAKVTKLDLATYYESIMPWILPYITNRPLTIVRCPENYHQCFYQKHITKGTPTALYGIDIKEKTKTEKSIYIKNGEGLLALVQLGVLEIHPWGSRIEKVEYPDMITFDLDPGEKVSWQRVVDAAFLIRDYLKQFKLESFVKTTGGKGLHVVIPIRPEYQWGDIKNFTHAFVEFLVQSHPAEYVSKMTKIKRVGKIYIDYLRNQRGSTAIAAYSTRARKGAPVATPLEWDELTSNRRDVEYTLKTLPKRLAEIKDPWRRFFKVKQSLRLKEFK